MPGPEQATSARVLVVDDSSAARAAISKALKARGLDVVGGASDPYMARDLIIRLKPDVLTLDLQMPGMDGLTFLAKLMAYLPMPVVVLSSLTSAHKDLALKAMDIGALEVFPKPDGSDTEGAMDMLAAALKRAATASARKAAAPPLQAWSASGLDHNRVVAIGASTGGTTAISALLGALPSHMPPILITQHMPAGFTEAFARRLDRLGKLRVLEAKDGDELAPGLALLAPGGMQMRLAGRPGHQKVRVWPGEPVNHVAPSVDVLFASVAECAGPRGIGVLLTGMGRDGADGLLAMRKAGGRCLAQDEASSAIWGMPGEAVKLGAAEATLSLHDMAPRILSLLREPHDTPSTPTEPSHDHSLTP